MSGHTQGPWIFDGSKNNIHVVQANNPDMRVCFMTSNGPTVANARLIAAAPDLLAALQWALPLAIIALEDCRQTRLLLGHDDIGKGTNDLGLWPAEVAQRVAAEAVVAKATGVAP